LGAGRTRDRLDVPVVVIGVVLFVDARRDEVSLRDRTGMCGSGVDLLTADVIDRLAQLVIGVTLRVVADGLAGDTASLVIGKLSTRRDPNIANAYSRALIILIHGPDPIPTS